MLWRAIILIAATQKSCNQETQINNTHYGNWYQKPKGQVANDLQRQLLLLLPCQELENAAAISFAGYAKTKMVFN